jgi:hypothetical protein
LAADPEVSLRKSVRLDGTAEGARYALESDQLRYHLDLRVRDELTTVPLTEFDSHHALEHGWSQAMCSYEFYDANGAGAALAEIDHDERGASCSSCGSAVGRARTFDSPTRSCWSCSLTVVSCRCPGRAVPGIIRATSALNERRSM